MPNCPSGKWDERLKLKGGETYFEVSVGKTEPQRHYRFTIRALFDSKPYTVPKEPGQWVTSDTE